MVVDQTLYLFWTEHFEGNVRSWNSRTNVSSVIHSDSAPLYDLKLFDSASETSMSNYSLAFSVIIAFLFSFHF
jgi:hypothetical protein